MYNNPTTIHQLDRWYTFSLITDHFSHEFQNSEKLRVRIFSLRNYIYIYKVFITNETKSYIYIYIYIYMYI